MLIFTVYYVRYCINTRWKASNYSFLWGMTLEEGVRYRLGTISPPSVVKEMTSLRVQSTDHLPDTFDWREDSPQYVGPIMDQGDCGASWAFSSASQYVRI